jgi:hypothetical protein
VARIAGIARVIPGQQDCVRYVARGEAAGANSVDLRKRTACLS